MVTRIDDDAGRTAVLQNVRGLMEFLRRYTPFDQMTDTDLAYLVEHSRLAFYGAGDVILTPAHGRVDRLYIVKQGQVRGERPEGGDVSTTFEIGEGEVFPLSALMQERPTRTIHRAATDTFCLELGWDAFAELFERSAPFQDYCLRGVGTLLERVSRRTQAGAAEQLGAQSLLNAPLRDIIGRSPVTCAPHVPVREAIAVMHREKVGSIVACDADRRPAGIFTLHDLLAMLVERPEALDAPIGQVMTPAPVSLAADALGFEAAITMVRHRFGHVCVVDDGHLIGVVSERDLFALQRVDLTHLTRLIARADTIAQLAALRPQIGRLIDAMLAHGADAPLVTRIITLLNDHTVERAIELCVTEHGDPGVRFTWLAFGSEGRREQTLSTDQDNGMLFYAPPGMTEAQARDRLLPLARRINQALAECGFPLCKGNVMASNPELCLSENEWRQRFAGMIAATTPANILRSTIYFDLRPVWGPPERAYRLFRDVVDAAADNTIFQRMLAANALRTRPPLGVLRDFVLQRDEHDRDTLDLKMQGLTPLTEGARLLALAHAVSETGTLERLDALAEQRAVRRADAEAWKEAFALIQLLRMRNHRDQARRGVPLSNRLDPDGLSEPDRRSLKEAFRQARRLQRRLELDYRL